MIDTLARFSNSRPLLWAGLLALMMPGCGGDAVNEGAATPGSAAPSSTGGSDAGSPAIVVDGSSTVYRVSQAVQEAFAAMRPDVNVVVDNHGTGGGFGRYLEGEVDIVDASRDAEPEETSKAKAQGIEWTRFIVAYDGITLVTNPKNDFAKSLTVDQLKALWSPGSTVNTWKDLDKSWPDRKIALYSPDNNSGTFEYFTEAIVGKKKSQREDVQQNSDDNILVNGVAGDPDGLGYFGYAYYAANKDKLRALAVQNGLVAKPVEPNPVTILRKTYTPLSRPLYIFVKNSSLRRKEVKDFVNFYLQNLPKFAGKAGYVEPTGDDINANSAALSATAAPGTK